MSFNMDIATDMPLENCANKFNVLSDNLTKLLHGRREGDRQFINALFDELNALDFKVPVVTNPEKAVLLINQFCFVVSPNDTFLVAKACQLIGKLIKLQQIKVEGKTLALTVNWCCQSLKNCADLAILDILIALEALLRGNGHLIERVQEVAGANGILMPLLEQQTSVSLKFQCQNVELASRSEVRMRALRCLEALVVRPADAPPLDITLLATWEKIFYKYLTIPNPPSNDTTCYGAILAVSLHGLRGVLSQLPEHLQKYLGEILGLVATYLNYGLPNYSGEIPQPLFSSPLPAIGIRTAPSGSESSKPSKSIRLRNKYKKADPNKLPTIDCEDDDMHQRLNRIQISDSENSDTEGEAGNRSSSGAKLSRTCQAVRQAALLLLLKTIRLVERHEIFGYWTWLLGAENTMSKSHCTLIGCISHDPSIRVRLEALNVLCVLLSGSRAFLQQAENCDKDTAFTAFSIALGNAVREIHHSLCRTLFFETSPPVVTQLLRCLAILVQNTAYKRLGPGLITKVIRNARPYTEHEDWTVQVASFTLLRVIVAADAPLPETLSLLKRFSRVRDPLAENSKDYGQTMKDSEGDDEEEIEDDDEGKLRFVSEECKSTVTPLQQPRMCWLLSACLQHLSSSSASTSVLRVECLQVIRALAQHYFESLVAPQLPALLSMLQHIIDDTDPTVRLHCGRVIEAVGENLQHSGLTSLSTSLNFWQTLLPGPVTILVQCNGDAAQRAVGCECLAAMGEVVFEQLPREQQVLLISLLVGCCADEESIVRAAAIQGLAVCSLYHNLREDLHFIMDACERVVVALEDNTFAVRMKASWSLGNVTDALLLNKKDENIEPIPDSLVMILLTAGVAAAEDSKLRSNIMRALGNLLRMLSEKQLQNQKFRETAEQAIRILVKYATSGNFMKVRWNSCYALGNMMRNAAIYSDRMHWPTLVFPALNRLVHDCCNFKVRIAAAQALGTTPSRVFYGPHFLPTWSALLGALEQTRAPEDAAEYGHRDTLLNQLCLALASLTALAQQEDLVSMQDAIVVHLDTLKTAVARCHLQMLPENTGILISASTHATHLAQQSALTAEQHSSAVLLTNLFLPASSI